MNRKNIWKGTKVYLIYTFVFSILLVPATYAVSVYAVTYPSRGLFKMSLNKTVDRGQIGMSSTRSYDSDIIAAYSKVQSSTTGYSQMPSSIWPNGYDMIQNNWTGTWNNYVDIMFTWKDRTGDSVGETYSYAEPSSWCTFWGQSYPCGNYSVIQIDTTRWANYGAGSLRQRLIEHETGHAVGMYDYCSSDSIMNNGDPSCNNGKWTAVMYYQPIDRTNTSAVYQ
ncbi:MAG TPA: hypothetical protein VFM02_03495 [Candidatus Paceibacterota bacterium]|nr:hypothetical protein [Candidatus Paceibacterota bacterium]